MVMIILKITISSNHQTHHIMKTKHQLDEHRLLKNQFIVVAVLLLIIGAIVFIYDRQALAAKIFAYAFVFVLVSVYHIYTYRQNLRDYHALQDQDKDE